MERLKEMMHAVVAEGRKLVELLTQAGFRVTVVRGVQATLTGGSASYEAIMASKEDRLKIYIRVSPKPYTISIVVRGGQLQDEHLEELERVGMEAEVEDEELRANGKAKDEARLLLLVHTVLNVVARAASEEF